MASATTVWMKVPVMPWAAFEGWSKSLEVTADGQGVVSHAGLALLRQLADKTGLTGGLSGRWPRRGC